MDESILTTRSVSCLWTKVHHVVRIC